MQKAELHLKNPLEITVKGVLCILIFFCPLKDSIFEGSLIATNLLFIILASYQRELKDFWRQQPLWPVFVGLFISMTLSNTMGINTWEGWRTQIQLFLYYALLFYSLSYFFQKRIISIRFLVLLIVIASSFHALDGVYQFVTGYDMIKSRPFSDPVLVRISGVVYSPNHFGLIMMVVFHVLFFLLTKHKWLGITRNQYLLINVLFMLIAFNLLYSGSRAAWLGTIIPLILYWFLNRKDKQTNIYCWIGTSILIGIVAFSLIDVNLSPRIENVVRGESGLRLETWKMMLEHIEKRPFFGYGIMSHRYLVEKTGIDVLTSPHNIFLEILLYLGILGLTVFGYYFYCILKQLWRHKTESNHFSIYLTIFAGLLINGQFGDSLITDKIFLTIWTLFCAIIFNTHFQANDFQ